MTNVELRTISLGVACSSSPVQHEGNPSEYLCPQGPTIFTNEAFTKSLPDASENKDSSPPRQTSGTLSGALCSIQAGVHLNVKEGLPNSSFESSCHSTCQPTAVPSAPVKPQENNEQSNSWRLIWKHLKVYVQ